MLKENTELILSARAEKFALGASDGVVIVIRDITSLKKMEKLKKSFVANVSHELRTPIQIIKGYSELLADADLSEEYKNWVMVIAQQAEHMEHMSCRLVAACKT